MNRDQIFFVCVLYKNYVYTYVYVLCLQRENGCFFFIFYFDPSISFIYIVHCLPQKEVFYTYAYSHICMKTDKPEVSLLYTRKITYVVVSDAYNLWINFRIILFFLCKNICIKKIRKRLIFYLIIFLKSRGGAFLIPTWQKRNHKQTIVLHVVTSHITWIQSVRYPRSLSPWIVLLHAQTHTKSLALLL